MMIEGKKLPLIILKLQIQSSKQTWTGLTTDSTNQRKDNNCHNDNNNNNNYNNYGFYISSQLLLLLISPSCLLTLLVGGYLYFFRPCHSYLVSSHMSWFFGVLFSFLFFSRVLGCKRLKLLIAVDSLLINTTEKRRQWQFPISRFDLAGCCHPIVLFNTARSVSLPLKMLLLSSWYWFFDWNVCFFLFFFLD